MRKSIWRFPTFKLLNKVGYSATVSRDNETEIRLILFFVVFLLFSFFIYLALPPVLDAMHLPDALDVFIQMGTILLSFDLMREIIASELEALRSHEKERSKEELIRQLRSQDSKISAHKYYVSQIINNPSGFELEHLNLKPISEALLEEKPLEDLGFNRFKDRRVIRCELLNIPDKFWQSLALSASMYVFHTGNIQEIYQQANYRFFQDVYAYLRAWVVCSIDNDSGSPMPIEVIGLHYPDTKEPDVQLYLDALTFIKNDLLEREKPKSVCEPSTLQSIKDRVEQLKQLIESHF